MQVGRRDFSRFLASAVALLAAILGSTFPPPAAATGRQRVLSPSHPGVPQAQVACFDKKSHTYYSKVEPWHCVFAGRVVYVGNIEVEFFPSPPGKGTFATFPIRGEWERIEWWDGWGGDPTRGNQAVNTRNGDDVEVVATRRVRCADGSTWFSVAEVIDEANVFGVRLPVCL